MAGVPAQPRDTLRVNAPDETRVSANQPFTLADLARIVDERAAASAGQSYTAKLLAEGPARAAKKFGEEAVEAVIAAAQGDRAGLVAEAADVFYHLLVVLKAADVPLDEVMAELQRRTAQSGLAEKAARTTNPASRE
jgi:phosphoribosyl-ATP pyrophosphohydrolase